MVTAYVDFGGLDVAIGDVLTVGRYEGTSPDISSWRGPNFGNGTRGLKAEFATAGGDAELKRRIARDKFFFKLDWESAAAVCGRARPYDYREWAANIALAADYLKLWVQINRPGGLEESVRNLAYTDE